MKFLAEIDVMPLKNLLDPQGKAVKLTLHNLKYNNVEDVRIGKHISLIINAKDNREAENLTKEIAQKVLHNPIMETFSYQIKVLENEN